MKRPSLWRADRAPGRGLAGEELASRQNLTGLIRDGRTCNSVLLLLFQLQQLCGLRLEAAQLLIVRLVLVHPLDRLVVPLPGLVLLAELPVGHGQHEPVEAVAAFA